MFQLVCRIQRVLRVKHCLLESVGYPILQSGFHRWRRLHHVYAGTVGFACCELGRVLEPLSI